MRLLDQQIRKLKNGGTVHQHATVEGGVYRGRPWIWKLKRETSWTNGQLSGGRQMSTDRLSAAWPAGHLERHGVVCDVLDTLGVKFLPNELTSKFGVTCVCQSSEETAREMAILLADMTKRARRARPSQIAAMPWASQRNRP